MGRRSLWKIREADRDLDRETLDDIKRFRRGAGLPVDDERVAYFFAEWKANRHPGGMWLTEAELEDYYRQQDEPRSREEVPADVRERLDALHERIWEDEEELAAAGVKMKGSSVDAECGRVEVEVVAADAETAQSILTQRYGDAVVCEWLGPSEAALEAEPWQAWTLDRTKKKLIVHCLTFKAYEVERAEHMEDEDSVTVLLYMRKPVSSVKLQAGEHAATVELSAPLGDRRVFDGATGRERERR